MERLKIAISGLVATYPFGGMFWHYMHFALGFARLGHDVLYLEDTAKWCYDPVLETFVRDGRSNAEVLARAIASCAPELTDRWHFRDEAGAYYGWDWKKVVDFCADADLFINISGSCFLRDEYLAAHRTVFIDTDPLYTQGGARAYARGQSSAQDRRQLEQMLRHDVFLSFGENVGQPDCLVPTELFDWRPTRQPIVLDAWQPYAVPPRQRREVLTTVASWEPAETGPVIDGRRFVGKSVEFERFIDLPAHSPLPMEIAMSGPAPIQRLQECGWRIRPAYPVSRDPSVYRQYLANSFAEWSVAKQAYVDSRSGWFSCRSASYLALGVPVIVQDTGFSDCLGDGLGVVPFKTLQEAEAGIRSVVEDYQRHCVAAQGLAAEVFDHRKVLPALLETVGV